MHVVLVKFGPTFRVLKVESLIVLIRAAHKK